MARKTPKINNFLIISGLFLILVFLAWRYHQARILSFNTTAIEKIDKKSDIIPVYIKAYPVGVDVEIKEASIVNGVWTVHSNSSSYLLNSAGIGDGGNIIIYGHNKDNIMGPIRHIKIGAIVDITGSDGQVYQYEVVKTDVVAPDNLSYLSPANEEVLTIYTCTGFFDTERFIAIAKRKT